MNSASPGGSLTGSFRQGVSRLSWLLRDQVYPGPHSVATKPNDGCATTLDHGTGGSRPASRSMSMTYSRPSSPNPPLPLNSSRPSFEGAGWRAGPSAADAARATSAAGSGPKG